MIMGEGDFLWFHWVSGGTCRTHDGIRPGQVPAKTDCLGWSFEVALHREYVSPAICLERSASALHIWKKKKDLNSLLRLYETSTS